MERRSWLATTIVGALGAFRSGSREETVQGPEATPTGFCSCEKPEYRVYENRSENMIAPTGRAIMLQYQAKCGSNDDGTWNLDICVRCGGLYCERVKPNAQA